MQKLLALALFAICTCAQAGFPIDAAVSVLEPGRVSTKSEPFCLSIDGKSATPELLAVLKQRAPFAEVLSDCRVNKSLKRAYHPATGRLASFIYLSNFKQLNPTQATAEYSYIFGKMPAAWFRVEFYKYRGYWYMVALQPPRGR